MLSKKEKETQILKYNPGSALISLQTCRGVRHIYIFFLIYACEMTRQLLYI